MPTIPSAMDGAKVVLPIPILMTQQAMVVEVQELLTPIPMILPAMAEASPG